MPKHHEFNNWLLLLMWTMQPSNHASNQVRPLWWPFIIYTRTKSTLNNALHHDKPDRPCSSWRFNFTRIPKIIMVMRYHIFTHQDSHLQTQYYPNLVLSLPLVGTLTAKGPLPTAFVIVQLLLHFTHHIFIFLFFPASPEDIFWRTYEFLSVKYLDIPKWRGENKTKN